ncbi:MAG: nucleoside-diphosphate sugar epimerase/dehydratase [Oscillospiraceae bacterium]|nr:nucleoside-diphosphate sugar epimerase/dehydratase [Oscillospiraceae bacterium]
MGRPNFNFRKVMLGIVDAFIIALCGVVTNFMLEAFDFQTGFKSVVETPYVVVSIIINVIVCLVALWICGAYNKTWRFFNIRDYLDCIVAMFFGVAVSTLILSLRYNTFNYVLPYTLISGAMSIIGIVMFRLIFKNAFIKISDSERMNQGERTLIVGAGHAGRIILNDIFAAQNDSGNPSKNLFPIGFVDDERTLRNTMVDTVRVLGTTYDIPEICASENISLIIFAIPSCSEEDRTRILDLCSKTECKIKIIPHFSQLLFDGDEGKPQLLSQVKDIKIEDLLGRKPITFDKASVKDLVNNKVCMVTGGGGSIGSELVRQIANYSPKQIIIVDIYENNAYDIQQELILEHGNKLNLATVIASVRDYDKMEQVFKEYKPELVWHAAAHKHVPLMETVPCEAVKNNIFGTYNVATLAQKYGVKKFVMISTDKAVNPTNVMGATKRCCEMIMQYMGQNTTGTEFVTTRFGNVLGSNGSVIPLFRRQIESGKPITVTHPDIIRYFMTIPEAVSLVLQAAGMAKGGEIFVLDMGKPVKITTLAENLCRMYGKVPYKDVEIKFTGLRPGEKLFEELLMDEEGLKQTANEKIFIGNQIDIDKETLLAKLQNLRECAEDNDDDRAVELLADIVPTFDHKLNK